MIVIMEMIEEIRLHFKNAVKIEGVPIQHLRQFHPAPFGVMKLCVRVNPADRRFNGENLSGQDKIAFVDDNDIGERDLLLDLVGAVDFAEEVTGIDYRYDRVELGLAAHILIHKEGLSDWRRVGKPGRLHDDAVKLAFTPHQPFKNTDEVTTNGATDAAIVHLKNLFIGVDDEIIVDADLAEFVDDDRVTLAVLLGQNAIQESGFSGSQIAGQQGDRGLRDDAIHCDDSVG